MPTERTCETCVFQKRGHCTLTAVAWNTVDNQCLHWGPRPPTNTLSSGNGDWTQTTDLTHGGSSPAGDWREPMVETSDGSNPSEEHVARHLLSGGLTPDDVEPDADHNAEGRIEWMPPLPEPPPDPLVCAQAMAELRASRNIIVGYWTKVVDEFSRMRVGLRKLAKAHRLLRGLYVLEQKATAHLCTANAQAISERDLLKQRVAELEAALKLERGAVEILGVELETRSGICACDVQDGWEQHRGGNTVGACWAAWARERALATAGEV